MESGYHELLWTRVGEFCWNLSASLSLLALASLAASLWQTVNMLVLFVPSGLAAVVFWYASRLADTMLAEVQLFREQEGQPSTPVDDV